MVLYIESAIICSSKCLAYPSLMQLFQAIRENKNWVLLGYVNRDDHGKHANTKKNTINEVLYLLHACSINNFVKRKQRSEPGN